MHVGRRSEDAVGERVAVVMGRRGKSESQRTRRKRESTEVEVRVKVKAKAKANAGVSLLRAMRFGRDDGIVTRTSS